MNDCIFCKIVNGEIDSYKIYEDSDTLAFLDINPRTKGHTLVIPKVHAETIFDLDDKNLEKLSVAVKRTTEKIDSILHPEGYNIGWNHGEIGGQVVPHLHVHIMPRYNGDRGGNMHSIINNDGGVSVGEVAKLFEI